MFDSSGEMTPPWGVPESIAVLAAFHHPGFEPLPRQLEDPAVRDPHLDELHESLVIDAAEVVADVGVEHMVHTLRSQLAQPLERLGIDPR
jgi:hypothetical protein